MDYNRKDIFSRGKPDYVSQSVWDEYIESGERKHFYIFNYVKTIIATSLIAFSINLIMGSLTDLFIHPRPLAQWNMTTFIIGLLGLCLVLIGLYIVDRVEELKEFRKKEKEHQFHEDIRRELREEIDKAGGNSKELFNTCNIPIPQDEDD